MGKRQCTTVFTNSLVIKIESNLVIKKARIDDGVGVEDKRVVVLVVDGAAVMTPLHL